MTTLPVSAALPADLEAELATLRRRAYGPGADIHSDAQAGSRLAELERLRRRRLPAAPVTPALANIPEQLEERPGPPAATGGGDLARRTSDESDPEQDGTRTREPPTTTGRRWRFALAAALAVVVVCVIAVSVTLSVTGRRGSVSLQPVGPPNDQERVRVESTLPRGGSDAADITMFDRYGDTTVAGVEMAGGARCLVIALQDSGVVGQQCAPEGMDVTAVVTVYGTDSSSGGLNPVVPALPTPAPVGSTVQYVWSGGDVWVSAGLLPSDWFGVAS